MRREIDFAAVKRGKFALAKRVTVPRPLHRSEKSGQFIGPCRIANSRIALTPAFAVLDPGMLFSPEPDVAAADVARLLKIEAQSLKPRSRRRSLVPGNALGVYIHFHIDRRYKAHLAAVFFKILWRDKLRVDVMEKISAVAETVL